MNHNHDFSFRRIEMFSDGVFAIIVTLLVLDLKVPEINSNASIQETINSLYLLTPQFISFTMSFLIVCIFWVNHDQFFSALKKADRTFMWLNNILLFWLASFHFRQLLLVGILSTLLPICFLGLFYFWQVQVFQYLAITFYSKTIYMTSTSV